MNIIKMGISNSREGILTTHPSYFTCISDQKITKGDIILHPQYSKVVGGDVFTFVVDDVLEERHSRGDWKDKLPSTFRKLSFKKETIPGKVMKELGYLQTDMVKDEKGVVQQKTFLVF